MSFPGKESDAIILDSRDHGESDKIITFFTKDRGRLSGIAKGAHRSKKRFQNKLELFSCVSISYRESRNSSLVFISEADLLYSFLKLRSRFELYTAASLIRETILIATMEREGESEIYNLLYWALKSLDEERPYLNIITIFLLRFYDTIGYRPDFSGCRFCSSDLSFEQKYSFHHMTGGLICNNCRKKRADSSTEVSLGTIRLLLSVITQPIEKLHRLQFSRQALQQSLTMLQQYGRHLLQRETHSWKALRELIHQEKR